MNTIMKKDEVRRERLRKRGEKKRGKRSTEVPANENVRSSNRPKNWIIICIEPLSGQKLIPKTEVWAQPRIWKWARLGPGLGLYLG